MTRDIPAPLRAAAGLAAAAVEEARRLPSRLASLPVVAVGAALQASMRVQQRYAELVGRGDQVLSGLREPDEQPPWARFDEDEGNPNGRTATYRSDDGGWAFADEEIGTLADNAGSYDEYVPDTADPAEPGAAPAAADAAGAAGPDAAGVGAAGSDGAGPDPASLNGAALDSAGSGGLAAGEAAGDGARGTGTAALDLTTGLGSGRAARTRAARPRGAAPAGAGKAAAGAAKEAEPPGDAPGSTKARAAKTAGGAARSGAGAAKAGSGATKADAGATTADAGPAKSDAGPAKSDAGPAKSGAGPAKSDTGAAKAGGKAGKVAGRAAGKKAAGRGRAAAAVPLENYERLTLPQVRARLPKLSGDELDALLEHERAHAARPPYLTMLENRLTRVRKR